MLTGTNASNYIPIINVGELYVNGLVVVFSNSLIEISPGAARDSTNSTDIVLDSTITINTKAIGANGIDYGIIQANSFYAVYLIADSSQNKPVAGLLSLNNAPFVNPTLPAGYNVYRRIGWALTNNASPPVTSRMWDVGTGITRTYYYDTGNIPVLTNGNATTFTVQTITPGIPNYEQFRNDTAKIASAYFKLTYISATTGSTVDFRVAGGNAVPIVSYSNGFIGTTVSMLWMPINITSISNVLSPAISYRTTSSSDSVSLAVAGFEDYL